MAYILGTGFFYRDKEWGLRHADEEFTRWWRNKMKYANPKPKRIFVIAHGGWHVSQKTMRECPADWIVLDGDLGHSMMLQAGTKPYQYCGWNMVYRTLSDIAYQEECDLIFAEQDCLAFGPWVERMYQDVGTDQMCFGKQLSGGPIPEYAYNGLVLCKHWFLPHFIWRYHGDGDDRGASPYGDGEHRWQRIMNAEPHWFRHLSFGYDRQRPFNVKDEVFYIQQVSGEELTQLSEAGLLEL